MIAVSLASVRPVHILIAGLLITTVVSSCSYKVTKDNLEAANAKIAQLDEAAKAAEAKGAIVIKDVVVKYVDRVKVIKEAGRVIEKEIPVYIPVGTPDLPSGFRVLHDAAATGSTPAEVEKRTIDTPVPVKDVASTINYNYEQCNIAYGRVESLTEAYLRLCDIYGCQD